MKKVWETMRNFDNFITDCNALLWQEMNLDELEDANAARALMEGVLARKGRCAKVRLLLEAF